jgi:carbamoyl-phosphate synthase large subunit
MNRIINSVLLLGSGALKIGEAGEFDYSGSQAIKALKEEGIRVILLNPNIATVQTSAGLADAVYFLPVTPEFATRVIAREKPDGILLGFGGQTALNCGLGLAESHILTKHQVTVLGTPISAIKITEDRKLFSEMLDEIALSAAKGKTVFSIEEGQKFAGILGFPVMVRAGFALGGTGSGVAQNRAELDGLLTRAFAVTGQVVIEECLTGWKEIEYEVMRDQDDNVITVCNMENFDPVGIHTGESIVVAPSQTLTDREYYLLREAAIRTIRKVGIVGECNIQFALDPESADVRVIEVNARLSRSSALASKATGYPLAYIAAKLAVGQTLPKLRNSVTGTSAFFEPALDYLVVKIPRWDLEKFTNVTPVIGSEMKSVGEVMAIGRTFEEAIQKAVRMVNDNCTGIIAVESIPTKTDRAALWQALSKPDSRRLFTIAALLYLGETIDKIAKHTGIDPWYLGKLNNIVQTVHYLRSAKSLRGLTAEGIMQAKKQGFADKNIAGLINSREILIRKKRQNLGIKPQLRRIDTMAGEYPARTNYLYLTYNAVTSDHEPVKTRDKVIILGAGPYAIGTSVEFDWCAVEAAKTLRKKRIRAVVINCNPETVSTDYDISDELYFEELSLERVLDIYEAEHAPLLVSFGGQIPNSLVPELAQLHVPILGTSPKKVAIAESRSAFGHLLDEAMIKQPEWTKVAKTGDLKKWVARVGYPVLVRPSFVLSGKAMSVIESAEDLEGYLSSLDVRALAHPLVVSRFLVGAREFDFDFVAKEGRILSYAICGHVEFGGVHSGDATMQFPEKTLDRPITKRLVEAARKIAVKLNITGPANIQFLVQNREVYVIECNARASRSFPFVSKTAGVNFVSDATLVMLGAKTKSYGECQPNFDAVKVPQFSFHKLRGSDPVTTVEMNSTGEVVGLGYSKEVAYLSGVLATGISYPTKKAVFVSLGGSEGKVTFLAQTTRLVAAGFRIFASSGTGLFLKENGLVVTVIGKIHEGLHPNVLDLMQAKAIDFAVVIPERAHEVKRGRLSKGVSDGYEMRRLAIDMGIPVFTNSENAILFTESIITSTPEMIPVMSLAEYQKGRAA